MKLPPPTMNTITITPAGPAQHGLLFRLLQLYYFEASHWSDEDILPSGLYDASEEGVRSYLLGGDDYALLAWVDGHPAGFALVEAAQGVPPARYELADMFVLPKYRGRGVAEALLAQTMLPSPAPWLVAVFKRDAAALRYWQKRFAQWPAKSVQAQADRADSPFHLFVVSALAPADA
ncbi:GNAT family N-acetyltransferase [Chitinimonas taiwanensis]|uniref:Acetyltransferase (GNAT) domain-containing protein n=1 Tax=Chitinimonas taiwanensis DSM 18899 TaxID=1121279 RepID=A0A1K2H974_9NEIS|nr:GNAT family N-acetyltransferase [Chitinimonas taiwanensis]SFZ73344.1 Acetyltransferase (GNAT) domain-containing protein [Chitinimonas taiwanensis DSM 18899]